MTFLDFACPAGPADVREAELNAIQRAVEAQAPDVWAVRFEEDDQRRGFLAVYSARRENLAPLARLFGEREDGRVGYAGYFDNAFCFVAVDEPATLGALRDAAMMEDF